MSISRHVLSILALSLQVLGYSADGRKVYAAVGRNIDLYCGTSKDDAQHGNWTYQEKESELEGDVPADIIEKTTKLEFRPVKESHRGIYSCISSNTTIVKINLSVGARPRKPIRLSVFPLLDESEYSTLDISWENNGNAEETE
ncbi:hypothetical protein Aduo_008505 [Ancylostoma duodenale]